MVNTVKSHKCNLTSCYLNITEAVTSAGSKTADQVVSSLLKKKASESGSNIKTVSLVQPRGGRNLQVTIGQVTSTSKRQLFSVDEFRKLQTDLHLSQKKTLEVAAALRVVSKNRKVVEPHLKQKLCQQNHSVDEFFTIKKFDLTTVKGKEVSEVAETVVYCSNLESFLQKIKDNRKLNEVHLKFGIDGGGGFLKICLSIQSVGLEEEEEVQKKRQKYEDGIAAKRFKESGVNKLLVLAIAPNTQENHSNVV